MRCGGQGVGPSGIRLIAGWESIEDADSDTHAIGQSVSGHAWESLGKSHRSGIPVPHITFVPVVAETTEKTFAYAPATKLSDAPLNITGEPQLQEQVIAPTPDMFGEPNKSHQTPVERKPRRAPKKKNPIRLQTQHSTDGRRTKKS